MKKLILLFIVMQLVFCLGLNGLWAEDECWNIPTVTENFSYPADWFPRPVIHTSSEEVAPEGYVELWAVTGEGACSPYQWTVSGTGFYFESIAGPTTATTYSDLEVLELWADNTSCGAAEIVVTDCRGQTATLYLRGSTGTWVLREELLSMCDTSGSNCDGYCGPENYPGCDDGPAGWYTDVVVGNMKYYFKMPRCWGDPGSSGDCNLSYFYWQKPTGPWYSRCESFTTPTYYPLYSPIEVPGTGSCNPHYPSRCAGPAGCVWLECDVYEWTCQ